MTTPKIENILPLTPLQEGLLFHATADTEGPDVYNVQVALDLDGPLNPERLRQAAQALVDQHPALRTSVRQRPNSSPVQIIQTRAQITWHHHDLTRLAEPRRQADAITMDDRTRRFSLTTAPLIRFILISLTPAAHRLLVTNHHIVLDGWSTSLLMRELFVRYLGGAKTALPPVTPSKAYFAWRAEQDRAAAEQAWRHTLAGLAEPTWLAPHTVTGHTSTPRRYIHHVPQELTSTILDQARRHGLTTNTVVQTAWALLLARLTNRDDVVFGATAAGRPPEVPGIETMIGMFIDTVPVRARLDPAESLAALGSRLQRQHSELTAHHHLGLTGIQANSDVADDLFDTLVVFENYPLDTMTVDESPVRITGMDTINHTHYPLTLIVIPGGTLTLHIGWRPDLFSHAEIEHIAQRFIRLLRAFADDPATRASAVDILDPTEKRQILHEWNDTARDVPRTGVSTMFEARAAATPDKIALRYRDEALTYAELDRRATELARIVRDRGVGREDLVALAVPRSTEMVVSLLAVLKSGAAYLPIDPEYPADRIYFMLGDARAALLITTDGIAKRLSGNRIPLVLVPATQPEWS
ncbi:MAG: condensation domain-containing protein [Pseudonocardiaceae bacterium]